jgi:hypothetical protein
MASLTADTGGAVGVPPPPPLPPPPPWLKVSTDVGEPLCAKQLSSSSSVARLMPAGTAEWLADAVRAHKESRPRRGGGASARAEAADEMRTEVTEHPCAKWVLEAPPGARVGRNSSSSQLSRSASAKPATKRAADAAPPSRRETILTDWAQVLDRKAPPY